MFPSIRASFFSFLYCIFFVGTLFAVPPYPIGFSIPESKIVKEIPLKTRDFAFIVPGDLKTYIYQDEQTYFNDYRHSYYAITCKKAGWDCMRHYEILANGCIPYFTDIDQCPEKIMTFLPKDLIKEAMHLEGVSLGHIDHSKFDVTKYNAILNKLLNHTRKYLTSAKMAEYILKTVNFSGTGTILFLSQSPDPDYLRCITLTGFKELLGSRVVDVPKVSHIYTDYTRDIRCLYGKGISYTRNVPDLFVNRDNIEERIMNREFELVIYGSIHRGTPYLELVKKYYRPEKIVYLCGEDSHGCPFTNLQNFFMREIN